MKRVLVFLSLIVISGISYATHNRAGEITYRYIAGLTYEATITTYTFAPSLADRCELTINWGDGDTSTLQRTNGPAGLNPNNQYCDHLGVIVSTDIKMNEYIGTHTYKDSGTYTITLDDPNRNAGIVNIPNSVNVPFYIQSLLVIDSKTGPIDSPLLLDPPIDNGCVGKLFMHNPGAFDADGDSISYELTICKGDSGKDIPGYTYPQSSNTVTLNPITGDLLWDSPVLQGEYNIAMYINAWRCDKRVSYVERDMQISIAACNNNLPAVQAINDTCIVEGTNLSFKVTANDPNAGNTVTLSASGGPFEISENPPTFPQPETGSSSVSSSFTWQTDCSHIRKYPWEVVFRAIDNSNPVSLVALKTLFITIIAPPVQNLSASPSGNSVSLKWSKSPCNNVKGYNIYRNNKFIQLQPANCETGVSPNSGYIMIGQSNSINDTIFNDNQGLEVGLTYGYMVTSYFNESECTNGAEKSCFTGMFSLY